VRRRWTDKLHADDACRYRFRKFRGGRSGDDSFATVFRTCSNPEADHKALRKCRSDIRNNPGVSVAPDVQLRAGMPGEIVSKIHDDAAKVLETAVLGGGRYSANPGPKAAVGLLKPSRSVSQHTCP
jgi:hypothetical protein